MPSAAVRVAPSYVAPIVADVEADTARLLTLNVALVAPAATVTLAGTVAAAVLLLESVTSAPPDGAALDSVTVPVEVLPPVTLVGLSARSSSPATGGAEVTPSAAKRIVSPSRAVSCAVVSAVRNVVTLKLALVAPAGTVTLAGTLAAPGRLLPMATTVPPAGAALGSVTVPVAGFPPTTLRGLTVKEESDGGGGGVPTGFTVKSAERVTPAPVTEIVTTVGWETAAGMIRMNPLVSRAEIRTMLDRYGKTAGLLLVTRRYWSKVSGDAMVTVPSLVSLPPMIVAGYSVSDVGVGAGITVICDCVLTPFQLAVIVAGVRVVTSLTCMLNEVE
jgi:hypothetical protein